MTLPSSDGDVWRMVSPLVGKGADRRCPRQKSIPRPLVTSASILEDYYTVKAGKWHQVESSLQAGY